MFPMNTQPFFSSEQFGGQQQQHSDPSLEHPSNDPSSYPYNSPSQSPSSPVSPMSQWGGYPNVAYDGSGGGGGWGPMSQRSSMMTMVPPEFDPPIDTTSLDRKTCGHIQQEVAKWVRETKYTLSPDEGKPLLRPVRNLFLGLVGGTFAGRFLLSQFLPALVHGPKQKAWTLGALLVGFPLGSAGVYFSQLPCTKAVLETKTPLGVQARYVFRVCQAEKSGMPPPPPPFAGTPPPSYGLPPYAMQRPGPAPSPWGQGQQQPHQPPTQPLQWNTFYPQPQYPPPKVSNGQHWEGTHGGEQEPPTSHEPRYRSWDDVRGSSSPSSNSSSAHTSTAPHPESIATD